MTTITSRPADVLTLAMITKGMLPEATRLTGGTPFNAPRKCSTDLEQHLYFQKTVLEQRIAGSEGEWRKHWQTKHAAVMRCLWSLSNAA